MKILILVILLTLTGCGYKCGDVTNSALEDPITMAFTPHEFPVYLIESVVCQENIDQNLKRRAQ